MPFCRKCGNEIKDDDLFCHKCGSPVNPVQDISSNGNLPGNIPNSNSLTSKQQSVGTSAKETKQKSRKGLIVAVVVLSVVLLLVVSFAGYFILKNKDSFPLFSSDSEEKQIETKRDPSNNYYNETLETTLSADSSEENTKDLDSSVGSYQICKCTRYNPDSSVKFYRIYEYNDSGNVLKETKYNSDDSIDYWIENIYDPDGNKTLDISYCSDGFFDEWTHYKYDSDGRLTEETCYKDDNSFVSKMKYEYDSAGNKVKEIEYSSEETIDSEAQFDTNGDIIQINIFNSDGSIDTASIIYDEIGNEKKAYILYDDTLYLFGVFTYDSAGNVIKRSSYDDDESEEYSYVYEYDSAGNEIKETYYNSDGSIDYWNVYEYIYINPVASAENEINSDTRPYFIIEDNIGIFDDEYLLKKSMEALYDETGIIPAVITVSNETWNEDYTSLESYAYDYYVNRFHDENHWLIIYSESDSDDWYWESVQGDNTDPVLTTTIANAFTESLHERLLQRNKFSIDTAIAISFYEYKSQIGLNGNIRKEL